MIRTLRHLLAALACLALCAGLLTACGDDEDKGQSGAQKLLDQTFGSGAAAIDSGRLDVAFALDPKGLLALGGPIKLTLDGPFSAPSKGLLPQFDVKFAATLGGTVFDGSVLSTGRAAFVVLDKDAYKVDSEFVTALRKGLADAADKQQPGLKSLGIDPLRWISGAQERGEERIAGVDTTRISGNVAVAKLLEDIDRLLTKAGGPGGTGGLLSPKLRRQIADAVKSAKVDIWTGTDDKILRQLAVRINFAFEDGKSPIAGLDAGKINLRLRLTDVNETKVGVTAPAGARPLADLTGGSISNFLTGIGNALTGKGGASIAGGPLLQCITGSGGETASLVRCISKLAD
ncbi:MAG: hypothetical protein QOI64_862 [Solirubrobacteraceae bacterium]|nr:hypothetical protein [Solirubrobacteraceae bacterium]